MPHPLYIVAISIIALFCSSSGVAAAKMGTGMETAAKRDTLITRYEPDESIFPNPERGFYIYSNLLRLDPDIGSRRDEGHTLIWGQIRLFENAGIAITATITLPTKPSSARVVDLLGKPVDGPKISRRGSTISLDLTPWQIATIAVGFPGKAVRT